MFNFLDFVDYLYNKYSDRFTYEEIKNLVALDEYEKDSPNSLGKSLVINKIKIHGRKNNNEIIDYEKEFSKGVNVLFADNSKGKSSIFKIIKFAITGDKAPIKNDVLRWLHKIFLEFRIGNVTYTTYINLTNKRTVSGLYRTNLKNLITHFEKQLPLESHLIHFQANTETKFKANMEKFFFGEFSYYSLKWTSSNKHTIDLIENKTTWKTYYKSIYLESKDYNVLFISENFGGQGKKILEMLLGLQLTSAINSLRISKDQFENKLQKQEFVLNVKETPVKNPDIKSKLIKINSEIDALKQSQIKSFQKSYSLKQYNELVNEIKYIDDEIKSFNIHKEEMAKQKNQLIKQINRLEEEIDFGMFFSNLEVKVCPRCDHDIEPEKKSIEKNQHRCMLCESEMSNIAEDQKEMMQHKLDELKKHLEKLNEGFELLVKESLYKEKEKDMKMRELEKMENEFNTVNFEEEDIESLTNLIEEKLALEMQIKDSNLQDVGFTPEKIKNTIDVLNSAIIHLNSIRHKMSESILESLKTLILNQLNTFGLVSVTDVVINESLDIQYLQNGELTKFNELNEGEQLRAKIAFFISLIQLDIKYSVGRHPRLLIIDSPGKEEVISKDLEGLSSLFKQLEENFGDQLQIIIGTALEPLKNASVAEKVDSREPGESVF
ncbi:AAA family ATPase [Bacillus subtilis]|uniref:AAA family ATPase n=1 Tax=Bacillus TaxID=1386 RepID=UPI003306D872